jgi:hypothetical protein
MADDELPDVPALRVLEPPPGGLETLRERLTTPRRRWWLVALPVAAAAAIALLVLVPRGATPMVPRPPTALRDPAVARDVTFYWVASMPGRTPAPPSRVVSIENAPVVTAYQP